MDVRTDFSSPLVTEAEMESAKPMFPKGKQPRSLQDRSKYGPHQGKRECARRRRQMRNLTDNYYGFDPLDLDQPYPARPAPTEEEMLEVQLQHDIIMARFDADLRAAKDRQDPPAPEAV